MFFAVINSAGALPNTLRLANCLYSFNMAAIAFSPKSFIPCFAVIWLNMMLIAILLSMFFVIGVLIPKKVVP